MSDLFKETQRVTFELSNICNYASIHPLCPTSKFTEKKVLPAAVVRGVMDVLGAEGYSGWVAFYGYSEPLIDPRFMSLVEYAKKVCPGCRPMVTTNGFMLTQEMLDDLGEAGFSYARISAYTEPEYQRLAALRSKKVELHVRKMGGEKWRPRIGDYDKPENGFKAPCFAPLIDIRITLAGKVGLCCVDYEDRYDFGDLREKPFLEIVGSGKLQEIQAGLKAGRRALPLCRRCGVSRHPGGI